MDGLKKIVTLLLLIGVAVPCTLYNTEQNASVTDDSEEWIVVFVHGIMSIKPHITFGNVTKFFSDQIANTQYARTIKRMREDPHFFKNQAMQQRGLVKVDMNDKSPGNASGAMAYVMNKMEKLAGLKNRKNHYYTYGWSGLLSQSSRYREAARFFSDLRKLIRTFPKTPKIRIVGYSHGGCVSLELAAVKRDLFPNAKLKIDEIVLLATPIQQKNEELISSPLFKRVYNLYSRHDRVQRIDIFNPSRYLSNRLFEPHKGFSLPDKLVQVELKLIRNQSHINSDVPKYKHLGDFSNKRIVEGQHNLLVDSSPGHGEVWFFGWTPQFYRKNFALYPLPMISILPFIQHHLATTEGGELPRKSVIVADVRPNQNTILFKRKYNDKTVLLNKEPFPDHQQLKTVIEGIVPYIPKSYTKAEYQKHTDDASKEARQRYVKKKRRNKGKNSPLSRSCNKKTP